MASLIPGFEYDVFISYRQKDNKHDGWVTEFVDNLKGELESTFKEEISVYFDINLHDGLLETHDVDASLKDKLKCLVFIPIISRTYCDPKSFAWEHEFKAFVELASQDQFGLKVKLPNGNIANRVLPIKIHDLDIEDIKLCESILGGFLRGIEFIYKESGFNRPLKPDDDEKINLNKTKYRNQIAKVALAIKEIITSLGSNEQKSEEVSREISKPISLSLKNNRTKILTASVILLGLIVLGFFFIPKLLKSVEQPDKSIAVLPFKLLSDEPDKQYLADGMMDAITLHLSKIKDLRVISRTSIEQYRGTTKTTHNIGQELGVEYLLEGSFQKFGDNARLIVQLIKAKEERHAWANEYNSKWEDVFSLQSEVAQKIAGELNAVISPEEKQLIDKTPTTSLTAYDFYQRGKDEYYKGKLEKASDFYRKALEYDSTFAQAYTGLALIYSAKFYWKTFFTEKFLDSTLILANIALKYNNQLAEAYTIRGDYYNEIAKPELAIEEYDKAIKFNPNDWKAYNAKGGFYAFEDLLLSIVNFQKAASLNRGSELPELLRNIGTQYNYAGFSEKAFYYWKEAFRLDGDSTAYYFWLGAEAGDNGNFRKAVEYCTIVYSMDSTKFHFNLLILGMYHMLLGNNDIAFKYAKKYMEPILAAGIPEIGGINFIAYIYWKNGYKEKAETFFNEAIANGNRMIELGRSYAQNYEIYYDLAEAYGFRGEKEKAYENLNIFNKRQVHRLWFVTLMKNDPLFDSIRNEPEFQQIARDVESKYQAEHERVRKWLEEQGKL